MDNVAFSLGQAYDSPFGKSGGATLGDLVGNIVQASIVVAGLLILFLTLFGGISMIVGSGQSDPQKVAKGRQTLTYALIGFIVVFTSFWVIRIIELMVGSDGFITNPNL